MNVIDDHSRLLVASVACPGETLAAATAAITTGGQLWGLPEQVLSDNGSCFGGVNKTGDFPDLLAWLGVRLVHARVYHPQTCGKVERFHQTVKQWLRTQPRTATMAGLQSQLDEFADFYNTRRGHRALRGATPLQVWHTTTKATPSGSSPPATRISIHHQSVPAGGAINLGRHCVIGLGTAWAGHTITAIRYGAQVLVLQDTHPIRAIRVIPGQRYYRQGTPRLDGQATNPPPDYPQTHQPSPMT